MAIAYNGILGPLHGRVGNVTGYLRNGLPMLRVATRRKDNNKSAARLAQREKLKLCGQFTGAFTGTDLFKKTFPAYGHTGTGLHRATSAVMKLAIQGTYPALSLSYPEILISKGTLPGAKNVQVGLAPNGLLKFSWDNNSDIGTAGKQDQAVMVAFDIELNEVIFSVHGGARESCNASLDVSTFAGRQVATWLSFISRQGDAADSVFCGMMHIAQ